MVYTQRKVLIENVEILYHISLSWVLVKWCNLTYKTQETKQLRLLALESPTYLAPCINRPGLSLYLSVSLYTCLSQCVSPSMCLPLHGLSVPVCVFLCLSVSPSTSSCMQWLRWGKAESRGVWLKGVWIGGVTKGGRGIVWEESIGGCMRRGKEKDLTLHIWLETLMNRIIKNCYC